MKETEGVEKSTGRRNILCTLHAWHQEGVPGCQVECRRVGLQDLAVEEDMDGATNTILTIFYLKLFHSLALNLFSMSVSLHVNIIMEFSEIHF